MSDDLRAEYAAAWDAWADAAIAREPAERVKVLWVEMNAALGRCEATTLTANNYAARTVADAIEGEHQAWTAQTKAMARVQTAECERDAALATLDRVRALCDGGPQIEPVAIAVVEIRAALDGPSEACPAGYDGHESQHFEGHWRCLRCGRYLDI